MRTIGRERTEKMKKRFLLMSLTLTMMVSFSSCKHESNEGDELKKTEITEGVTSTQQQTTEVESIIESDKTTEKSETTDLMPDQEESSSIAQLSEEDAALLQSYLGGDLDIEALKNLTDENKKTIQKEAKENGYLVEFDSQNKVIIKDEDGQDLTVGKIWPENEYTEGLPKMEKGNIVNTSVSKTGGTVITLEGVTLKDAEKYTKKLRKAGYKIEQSEMKRFSEEESYYYEAKNKNGYQVMSLLSNNKFVITVIQSENVEK